MPVHDWTRVKAGIFHHFHQSWIRTISDALNAGLMPSEYYALTEQVAEGPIPDVIALEALENLPFDPDVGPGGPALAIAERPPQVRYTEEVERDLYAHAADRIVIHQASGDRVVAYIEIVSPGNKHSPLEIERFSDKLDEAIERCCHLLVIDVLPPGRHDPKGMHAAFWERSHGSSHGCTPEEPLGMSAYRVRIESETLVVPHAYFEPVALGAILPEMPLFLTDAYYINVPLERTYLNAWRGVPQRWQYVIEGRFP